MTTFRTSMRIAAGHRLYILIYLLVLSQIGLLTGLAMGSQGNAALSDERANVAVIDRDGSVLSRGIASYVQSTGATCDLKDERRAMQDAIAQGCAEYILIIPAGYGAALEEASTSQDGPLPEVEVVMSESSADGPLMDQRVNAYLNQLHEYLATGTIGAQQAVELADSSIQETARAELIANVSGSIPESLTIYATMSIYPLLTFPAVIIAILMASLGRRPVRSRILASPETSITRSLGLLGACVAVGLVGWAWICVLGLVVFGLPVLSTAAPLLGVVALALLAYTMVGVSVGFLLGQLNVSENWANMIGNISGMVLVFLAGGWVPSEFLPERVVELSRLTPGYWAAHAIQGAYKSLTQTPEDLLPLVADCGVCALFAVAIGCVAVMVGRARARASL